MRVFIKCEFETEDGTKKPIWVIDSTKLTEKSVINLREQIEATIKAWLG